MTTKKIILALLSSSILLNACNSGGSTTETNFHNTKYNRNAQAVLGNDLKLRNIQSLDQLKKPTVQEVKIHNEFGIDEIVEQHNSKGLLENYENADLTGFKVSLFSSQSFSKVNQDKDVFQDEPLIQDIFQNKSLDCGFLASLATILATENGATFLEEKLKETTTKTNDGYRKVYVQLYDSMLQPKLVELEKERDWSMVSKSDNKLYSYSLFGWYYDLTSSAKLWVHLFERAYKRLYTSNDHINDIGVPQVTVMRAVYAGSVLSALTGLPTISKQENTPPSTFVRKYNGNPMVFNINYYEAYDPKEDQDYFIINNKSTSHYYAIVSKIATRDGEEGVWVYNTLQAGTGLDYLRAYLWSDDTKSFFFMPLKALDKEAGQVIAIDN